MIGVRDPSAAIDDASSGAKLIPNCGCSQRDGSSASSAGPLTFGWIGTPLLGRTNAVAIAGHAGQRLRRLAVRVLQLVVIVIVGIVVELVVGERLVVVVVIVVVVAEFGEIVDVVPVAFIFVIVVDLGARTNRRAAVEPGRSRWPTTRRTTREWARRGADRDRRVARASG